MAVVSPAHPGPEKVVFYARWVGRLAIYQREGRPRRKNAKFKILREFPPADNPVEKGVVLGSAHWPRGGQKPSCRTHSSAVRQEKPAHQWPCSEYLQFQLRLERPTGTHRDPREYIRQQVPPKRAPHPYHSGVCVVVFYGVGLLPCTATQTLLQEGWAQRSELLVTAPEEPRLRPPIHVTSPFAEVTGRKGLSSS